jgi:hypothetical protein
MPFVVHTEADLLIFMRPHGLRHPFRKPPVEFRIANLPQSESRAWEGRFDTLRQQCGCASGAIALGAFTLGVVAYAFHRSIKAPGAPTPRELFLNGVLFLVGLILSALLGKLLGLSLATIRFRRACFELRMRLQNLQTQPCIPE